MCVCVVSPCTGSRQDKIETYDELPRDGRTKGLCDLVGILAHACRAHPLDDAIRLAVAHGPRDGFSRSPFHLAIPPGVPAFRVCGAAIGAVLLPARARRLYAGKEVSGVEVGKLFCFSLTRPAVRFGEGSPRRGARLGRSPRVRAGRARRRMGVRHRARFGERFERSCCR
jgi:hypothetical protein